MNTSTSEMDFIPLPCQEVYLRPDMKALYTN